MISGHNQLYKVTLNEIAVNILLEQEGKYMLGKDIVNRAKDDYPGRKIDIINISQGLRYVMDKYAIKGKKVNYKGQEVLLEDVVVESCIYHELPEDVKKKTEEPKFSDKAKFYTARYKKSPKIYAKNQKGSPLPSSTKVLEEYLSADEWERKIKEQNEKVRNDLLKHLKNLGDNPNEKGSKLEEYVTKLLEKAGYENVQHIQRGDIGIDISCEMKTPGRPRKVAVQTKNWNAAVQLKDVQKFIGVMTTHKYPEGLFITTSKFTPKCMKEAESAEREGKRLELIDGKELIKMHIKHKFGIVATNKEIEFITLKEEDLPD